MGSHLSLLVSATMLVATLVYYYRMVLLTELTTEATLFNTLYAEYGTSQMHDSIQYVGALLVLQVFTVVASTLWFHCSRGVLVLPLCCHSCSSRCLVKFRAVEAFSHDTSLSYEQIICKKSSDQLWDRKLDHDWQRIYHWYAAWRLARASLCH